MRKLLLEADHISKIYDIDTKNPFIAMKDISLKYMKEILYVLWGLQDQGNQHC